MIAISITFIIIFVVFWVVFFVWLFRKKNREQKGNRMDKAVRILMTVSIIVVSIFSVFGASIGVLDLSQTSPNNNINQVEIESVNFVDYPISLSVGTTRTVTIRITYDVGDYQGFTSSNVEEDLYIWSSNNQVLSVINGYSISEIWGYWWDEETDYDSDNTEKTFEVSFSIRGLSSGYESLYVEVSRDRTVTQYRSIRVTSW